MFPGWQLIEASFNTKSNRIMYTYRFTGLRLADKRSLPCPRRNEWLAARDELYEEIMHNAWNAELGFFGQSYEDRDVLDSSLMIMPLVFFSTPVCRLCCSVITAA